MQVVHIIYIQTPLCGEALVVEICFTAIGKGFWSITEQVLRKGFVCNLYCPTEIDVFICTNKMDILFNIIWMLMSLSNL